MKLPEHVEQALAGRRVMVLGGTGFIGRHLVRALAQAASELILPVRDPRAAERTLGPFAAGKLVVCDLTVAYQLTSAIEWTPPELVFNLAGYGIDRRQQDEALLHRINVDAVAKLLAALEQNATTAPIALVHVGSGFEYGDAGGDLDERGPAVPRTAYARSKLAATELVMAACRERGLRAVVARPFTVYGPGEHEGRLLPTLIAAARSGQTAALSAGTQQRDFVYVEDVVAGLLHLAAAPAAAGQIVNIATGRLATVRYFAETAARLLGLPPAQLQFGAIEATASETAHAPVTTAKLQSLTHFAPATTIEAGIQRTIDASA